MKHLHELPLHPFFFAAYAVLLLYSSNLADVLPHDVIPPLVLAIGGAGAALLIATLVLRDPRRGALVASAFVGVFFAFGYTADPLADLGLGLRTQLAGSAIVVLGTAVGVWRFRTIAPTANQALNVLGAVLVALSLVSIVPYEVGRATRSTQPGTPQNGTSVHATRPGPERDVYYLVFDRYGSNWSLERNFGIVNEELPTWLERHGFQVVPGARANYASTDLSLASTLNLRFLDHLTETFGRDTDDRAPVRNLLQRHEVGRFLQSQGYRYFHLGSWWEPTASNEIADAVLRYDERSEFGSVLHETTILPYLERALFGPQESNAELGERHRQITLYQLRQLERLRHEPGRKFVLAHMLLPHPPYVFRADGSAIPEGGLPGKTDLDLTAEQLEFTNAQIRSLVSRLLEGPPSSHPIIVIQADEGPHVCELPSCPTERQDRLGVRFGILGAYYLPDADTELSPDHSAVNTFRLVLSEYFGADLPPLPNRSYSSPPERIYDFEDVTELLPLPGSDR